MSPGASRDAVECSAAELIALTLRRARTPTPRPENHGRIQQDIKRTCHHVRAPGDFPGGIRACCGGVFRGEWRSRNSRRSAPPRGFPRPVIAYQSA